MTSMRSMVYGSLPLDLSTPMLQSRSPQEFVRDDVLVTPSLDPYEQMSKAKEVIASGKSLAVESGAFGVKAASW